MGFARQELSTDSSKNHAELFGLLSGAQIKFALAAKATALPSLSDSVGTDASYEIFRSTYDALSHDKWEDHLPYTYEIPKEDWEEQVLPYPIMIALAYFLDLEQTVCLGSWNFHTGNPNIDQAIVTWPNSILWGLPSKMQFFHDIFDTCGGTPPRYPLLSNQRTRAVQLLTVGKLLLDREIRKIRKPQSGSLYRV